MKKRKKHSKKEEHKLLKFFFLALFFILLGITIAKHSSEQQKVASYYPPQKTLQIGWFTIFKRFVNPKPNDNTPTPTPTPCPGGTHEINIVQGTTKQSVAFALPPVANPPSDRPIIIIDPPTPIPQPISDPCYKPFP